MSRLPLQVSPYHQVQSPPMRVPIEWLKDFVLVELSPDDLAERLTMAGLEVESVEDTPYGAVLAMYITPNRGDCLRDRLAFLLLRHPTH